MAEEAESVAICPNGGLCNRMLNIASVVRQLDEQESDAVVHVAWVPRDACPAEFGDLFEPNERLLLITSRQVCRATRSHDLSGSTTEVSGSDGMAVL